MTEVRIITDAITKSGESPMWDPDAERLFWIDNAEGLIFRSTAEGREVTVWPCRRQITAAALHSAGGLIVVGGKRVWRLDLETTELEDICLSPIEGDTPFNDAKVDRQGRFVAGTVDPSVFEVGAASGVGEYLGGLRRLDADLTMTPIADGIGIVNGPSFSRDGTVLYCNDSWARVVYAYAYDPKTGTASDRRVFTEFDEDSVPDGATVDEEDCLWIAAFHGGEIRRYSPDGRLDRRVAVPVERPSSVMFGGSDLDILFVTSQAEGHGVVDAVRAGLGPLAGRVFAIHGLGVRGLPEPRFATGLAGRRS